MDGTYSQRVKGIWSTQLRDGYAAALCVCLIVAISTVAAIKFNWDTLVELTMSVLDIKPLLFFLLCWCVVRIIELMGAALFAMPVDGGALANRLRDATSAAASVMVGAFFGAIAGLYVGTSETCAHPGALLPLFILFLVVVTPLVLATGALDPVESGYSKLAASWISVSLMLIFVLWLAHDVVKQESRPRAPACPKQAAAASSEVR